MTDCDDYICFPTINNNGKKVIECIKGNMVSVVRNYMHPTDDIKWTMGIFEATVQKMCNGNRTKMEKDIKKSYPYEHKMDTRIEYNDFPFFRRTSS